VLSVIKRGGRRRPDDGSRYTRNGFCARSCRSRRFYGRQVIETGFPEEFFSSPKTSRAQQFLERCR
jgi:ABC-type histidine transport system ATPase subunit